MVFTLRTIVTAFLLSLVAACSGGTNDESSDAIALSDSQQATEGISERILGGWYCYIDEGGRTDFWIFSVYLRDGRQRSIVQFESNPVIPNSDSEDWEEGIWWVTGTNEVSVQFADNGLIVPYRLSTNGVLSPPDDGYSYKKCHTTRL